MAVIAQSSWASSSSLNCAAASSQTARGTCSSLISVIASVSARAARSRSLKRGESRQAARAYRRCSLSPARRASLVCVSMQWTAVDDRGAQVDEFPQSRVELDGLAKCYEGSVRRRSGRRDPHPRSFEWVGYLVHGSPLWSALQSRRARANRRGESQPIAWLGVQAHVRRGACGLCARLHRCWSWRLRSACPTEERMPMGSGHHFSRVSHAAGPVAATRGGTRPFGLRLVQEARGLGGE